MLPESDQNDFLTMNNMDQKEGNLKSCNIFLANNELTSKSIMKKNNDEEVKDPLLDDGVNARLGSNGNALTRQDTVVGGCAGCAGGRLVSCARIKCSPVLCWERKSPRQSACMLTSLVVVFLLSFIGTITLCFTNFFSTALLSGMVLKNDSFAFHLWREPPVHPVVKVHVFNYTNALEVMNGKEEKLRVEDIGPYVYLETQSKVNIKSNPNGTVTYQEKRSYQFMPEMSVGAQFDKLLVPNLPQLSAISMSKDASFIAKMGLSALFSSFGVHTFRMLPLHRFLWGYDDELVDMAKPLLKLTGKLPFEKFGILAARNGTSTDRITLNTGEIDIHKMGIIDRINGKNSLGHWGTAECNRMDGSDGSMFPPKMLDKKEKLFIFNKEICRRLPLVYEREIEVQNGIKALRYAAPKNIFDTPATNPENECYCHLDSANCPVKGVFNSSPCAFDAPVFTSFPHFYLGDESLIEAIDGLDPTPDKHSFFVDIHPSLGMALAGSSRIQLNVQARKGAGITGLDFLPDGIMLPVVWIEVSLAELPPELRSLVYHGTFSANVIRLSLTWGCVTVLIVSLGALLMTARNRFIYCGSSRQSDSKVPTLGSKY